MVSQIEGDKHYISIINYIFLHCQQCPENFLDTMPYFYFEIRIIP